VTIHCNTKLFPAQPTLCLVLIGWQLVSLRSNGVAGLGCVAVRGRTWSSSGAEDSGRCLAGASDRDWGEGRSREVWGSLGEVVGERRGRGVSSRKTCRGARAGVDPARSGWDCGVGGREGLAHEGGRAQEVFNQFVSGLNEDVPIV